MLPTAVHKNTQFTVFKKQVTDFPTHVQCLHHKSWTVFQIRTPADCGSS